MTNLDQGEYFKPTKDRPYMTCISITGDQIWINSIFNYNFKSYYQWTTHAIYNSIRVYYDMLKHSTSLIFPGIYLRYISFKNIYYHNNRSVVDIINTSNLGCYIYCDLFDKEVFSASNRQVKLNGAFVFKEVKLSSSYQHKVILKYSQTRV